jgi:hypothetical protein
MGKLQSSEGGIVERNDGRTSLHGARTMIDSGVPLRLWRRTKHWMRSIFRHRSLLLGSLRPLRYREVSSDEHSSMNDSMFYVFRMLERLPNKAKRLSRSDRATNRVSEST